MGRSTDSDGSLTESYLDDIEGEVLSPEDEAYDEARQIWNSALDGSPDFVVQPRRPEDVQKVVDFVREEDVLLSMKGGGHDYAGNSSADEGLMVDFARMDDIHVDPDRKVAEVGPGATWQDVYAVTEEHGLVTPGGVIDVGVPGLTLGGGIDMILSRTHGLTVDNLRSVELVTADGELIRASEDENADLFWGMCGAGWNYGVATSFEFDLHEIEPEILAGRFVYPIEDVGEVLRFYRDRVADAPNGFGFVTSISDFRGRDDLPPSLTAQPLVDVSVFHVGPVPHGRGEIHSMRSFGDPIFHEIEPQSLTAIKNRAMPIFVDELIEHWYTRSHCLDELSDDAIEVVEQYTSEFPNSRMITIPVIPLDGAIAERESDATAFPFRDSAFEFSISVECSHPEHKEEIKTWAQDFYQDLKPYSNGTYVNTLSYDEEDRVEEAYGDNYDDLVELKNEWDPDNLFRANHNIEPTV